jgi:hypothetical protein
MLSLIPVSQTQQPIEQTWTAHQGPPERLLCTPNGITSKHHVCRDSGSVSIFPISEAESFFSVARLILIEGAPDAVQCSDLSPASSQVQSGAIYPSKFGLELKVRKINVSFLSILKTKKHKP